MHFINIGKESIYPNIGIRIEEGYDGVLVTLRTSLVLERGTLKFEENLSTFTELEIDIKELKRKIDTLDDRVKKEIKEVI